MSVGVDSPQDCDGVAWQRHGACVHCWQPCSCPHANQGTARPPAHPRHQQQWVNLTPETPPTRARRERCEAAAAAAAAGSSSDGTGSPPLSPPSPLPQATLGLGHSALTLTQRDAEANAGLPPAPVIPGRPDIAGILADVCALAGPGAEVGVLAAGASTHLVGSCETEGCVLDAP